MPSRRDLQRHGVKRRIRVKNAIHTNAVSIGEDRTASGGTGNGGLDYSDCISDGFLMMICGKQGI